MPTTNFFATGKSPSRDRTALVAVVARELQFSRVIAIELNQQRHTLQAQQRRR
jgi:hypothetical protein